MFRVSTLLCALSFIVSVYLIYIYIDGQRDRAQLSMQMILQQAHQAAAEIGRLKAAIKPTVEELAQEMNSGDLGLERLEERLREIYLGHKDTIFEVGVAFNPDSSCPPGVLHAPHYGKKDGVPANYALEDYYESPYTDWPWYKNTIAQGARWIEPYMGDATKEVVVGFASPFYCPGDNEGKGEPAGIVRANSALIDIRERLMGLQLGKTGYGFILSASGTFIAHPVAAYLYDLDNAYDREDVKNNPDLKNFVGRGLAGEEGLIDYVDLESGDKSWLVLTPVPGINWSLGAVFVKREVADSVTDSRHLLIRVTTSLIFFFSSLVFLLSGAYKGRVRTLWFGGSMATAGFLAAGIVIVCFLAFKMPSYDDSLEIRVTGPAGTS